jgi:hypothetical protein
MNLALAKKTIDKMESLYVHVCGSTNFQNRKTKFSHRHFLWNVTVYKAGTKFVCCNSEPSIMSRLIVSHDWQLSIATYTLATDYVDSHISSEIAVTGLTMFENPWFLKNPISKKVHPAQQIYEQTYKTNRQYGKCTIN